MPERCVVQRRGGVCWSFDVRYRYNGETGGKSKQYNGDAQWNRRKSIVIRDGVGGRKQGEGMRDAIQTY